MNRHLPLGSVVLLCGQLVAPAVFAQGAPAPAAAQPPAAQPAAEPAPAPSAPAATAPSTPPAAEAAFVLPTPPEPAIPAAQPAPLAEPAPVPVPVPIAEPAADAQPAARLDYSDGSFYLRSVDDNIVLMPSGRMHIDMYSFGGQGVSRYHKDNGTGLKTNLFFRRFIMEMGGMVRKQWFFWIGGNFGPTAVDANQAPQSSANVYDGFIGWMPTDHLKLYAGQYNAPFTMENVTSSRWMDLMERALVVRTVATPYNKADGLMAWGETSSKTIEYQLGVFGGDGMNRPNIDNRFDGMGRFLVRPLIGDDGQGNRLHIGVGARYGSRDRDFVRYDAPSLSTPGGYTFWSPKYGSGAEETHIMPDAAQFAGSLELYAPFERFDIKGEVVYVNEGRREALLTDRLTTLRKGTFSGAGGYLQLSWWPLGSVRVNGNPAGYYGLTKLPKDLGKQDPYGLQLVARAELMRLNYDGNARFGTEATGNYAATSNIDVNAFQFGVNYWATKHIRLSAEYSLYDVPSSDNQAVAPGRKINAASDAEVLHEISFRLGLAL